MNYQMSLDPADQPLAITNKVVTGDEGGDEAEDEEEEVNSESAGHSESVALSGSMGHSDSVKLSGSVCWLVSDQNYISSGQVLVLLMHILLLQESLGQGIERALVLHDDSTDSEDKDKRSGGFARVKVGDFTLTKLLSMNF